MKQAIHPKYNTETAVACACGNTFVTGSIKDTLRVEICNACHPFYTGQERLVDTARRVEKFQDKMSRVEAAAATRKGKKAKDAKRATAKAEAKVKTTAKAEAAQ